MTACTQWDRSTWSRERIGQFSLPCWGYLSPWTCLFTDNARLTTVCVVCSHLRETSLLDSKKHFSFSNVNISESASLAVDSLPAIAASQAAARVQLPLPVRVGTGSSFPLAQWDTYSLWCCHQQTIQGSSEERIWVKFSSLETLTPGNAKKTQASKLEDGCEWLQRTSQRP